MSNPFATATSGNPFGGNSEAKAEEATAEEVKTEEVQTTEADETPEEAGEDAPKKTRKRRVTENAKRKTNDQVKYILSKYKDNTVNDLMKDPFLEGLTEQQIRKTVFDAKKALKEKAETLEGEKKAALLQWIEENLPNRSGDGRKGKRGTVMDSALDDIMSAVFGS